MNKSETLLLSGKKESDKSVVLTSAKFQPHGESSKYYAIGYSADSDNAGSLSAVPFWYGKISKSRYALTDMYSKGINILDDGEYAYDIVVLTDKDGDGIASTNISDAEVLDSITMVRIDDPATVKTVTIPAWYDDNELVYSYLDGFPFGYADASLAGKQFILTFDPPPTDSYKGSRHLFGGVL